MGKIKEGDWVRPKAIGGKPAKVVVVHAGIVKVKRLSKIQYFKESEVIKT